MASARSSCQRTSAERHAFSAARGESGKVLRRAAIKQMGRCSCAFGGVRLGGLLLEIGSGTIKNGIAARCRCKRYALLRGSIQRREGHSVVGADFGFESSS